MPKGSRNPQAILTEKDVLYILSSDKGSRALGKEFGVHATTIQRVRSGKNWSWKTGLDRSKHVPINFNTSGVVGVNYHKRSRRWIARLKKKHLGSFVNKKDAIESRRKAADKEKAPSGN